jgi:hypothetical protein
VQHDVAAGVEDAEVQGLRVQIDPAAMLVGLGVESQGALLERLVV